jgi:tetratricopeptide (TPR) repeat protein
MIRWILPLLGVCGVAIAETLVLTDGRRLEGDVKRDGGDWVLTDAEGRVLRFGASEVKSIELSRRPETPAAGRQRLEFLKRYAETVSDPALPLARYEEFVKQYPDLEAEAKPQLDLWRSRQGQVRVGGKWLGGEELARWEERLAASLDTSRQLISQNRLKDALASLDTILAADAGNVGALYLQGIIQYRLEQLPAARKAFEGVLATLPDHGASLNNLAAVSWRQKQEAAALSLLDRASSNMPLNQVLVDNIAEAMHGVSREAKNSAAAKRLAKKYEEQEPQLARSMAGQGYYRWGSTWVTKAQYDELQRVQREIGAHLDRLAREYGASEQNIARMTQDIDANNRTLRRIESDSLRRDASGVVVRLPYPSTYYDVRNETERLLSRRQGEIARLQDLRREAEKVQSRLAVPPYRGALTIMGETNTPLVLRRPSTTQPAP